MKHRILNVFVAAAIIMGLVSPAVAETCEEAITALQSAINNGGVDTTRDLQSAQAYLDEALNACQSGDTEGALTLVIRVDELLGISQ